MELRRWGNTSISQLHRTQMRNATLIAITTISILTSACSSTPIGAVSYQDHQLQSLGTVAEGTILQIRGVSASRQDALSNGSGSVLGGIVGAVVGQSASKGRGKLLTTALGSVAGSMGGRDIAQAASQHRAWEMIIKTADGRTVAIVQEADGTQMRAGQRIYLISTGGRVRVAPAA